MIIINNRELFNCFLFSPFKDNFQNVTDDQDLAVNSVAWSSKYNALRINDGANNVKGCIEFYVGYHQAGDMIRVDFETKRKSGITPKIIVNSWYNKELTNSKGRIFDCNTTITNDEFNKIGFTIPVKQSGYITFAIGSFTADIGEFYIRNLRIDSSYSVIPRKLNAIEKTNRIYVLNGGNNAITLRQYFSYDLCSVTLEPTAIKITHTTPFTINKNGLALVQLASSSNKNWDIRARSQDQNGLYIEVFDKTTNALISTDTLKADNTLWINIIHHGWDYIN